jgi:hypothetical protein
MGPGLFVMGRMLWRGLHSGEFLYGEDGPPKLITRVGHPGAYWAIAVFSVALLVLGVAVTIDMLIENSN